MVQDFADCARREPQAGCRANFVVVAALAQLGQNAKGELAGLKPKTVEFNGDRRQAIDFVWSTNFDRRYLTSSQTAMVLAERRQRDPGFMKEVVEPLKEESKERLKAGKDADATSTVLNAVSVAPDNEGAISRIRGAHV